MFGVAAVFAFFIVIAIIVFLIVIWYKVAKKFESIAADKGYVKCHIWAWTFWLGPIGMLMVIAMPDKTTREILRTTQNSENI